MQKSGFLTLRLNSYNFKTMAEGLFRAIMFESDLVGNRKTGFLAMMLNLPLVFVFSSENRPPLPPPRKSEERLSPRPLVHKPEDSKPRPVQKELSPEVGAGNKVDSDTDKLNATGSSTSVASSMDDTPMLQKLKDMNKK